MLRRFGQCLTWHITLWLGVALAGLPFSATADVRKAFPVLRPALTVFTDREGLPQNTVGAMACDAQGHLWVGTQDGLARYDGRGWQVVVLPAEAASHNIHALLPASDGALWVGTLDGLLRLQRGQWTVFGAGQASEAGGVPLREVYDLLEEATPQGQVVWAGGDGGVARFVSGRWERVPIRAQLPEVTVKCLARTVDATGQEVLWIGTTSRGLVRQVGETAQVLGQATGIPGEYITCLLPTQDADGQPQLWGGTQGGGLFLLDGQGHVRQRLTPDNTPLPNGRVQCLAEVRAADGRRHLWIGTDGGGVACYTGQDWRVYATKQGIPSERVFSLLPERGDITPGIWIGTGGGGLARCDLEGWQSITVNEGLPDRRVYAFLESAGREGNRCFWIGTSGGLLRAENGQLRTYTRKDGLPGDTVLSLAELPASNGGPPTVWAGCDGGLARLVGDRWQVEPTPCDGRRGTVYFSLAVAENAAGQPVLWAFTYDGVQYLENGRWQRSELPEFNDRHIPYRVERDPARPDVLWGSVYGLGVLRYADGQWTLLPRQGLSTDRLLGLGVFGTGDQAQLWVGTQSQGVLFRDLNQPQSAWRRFSTYSQPGLPNDFVYGVLMDARGRLYFMTNRGVAQWTPENGPGPNYQTRVFSMNQGLPSNECNQGAFYRDSAERLWVGTVAGAAVYDPALETLPPVRSVVLEQTRVNGRPFELTAGQRLRHAENNLAFEYALLDFSEPDAIRYQVQLEGYDPAPSAWTTETRAVYTNVPSGTYTFRVWARDPHGRVIAMSPLAFQVLTPWWLTWWAWVGYVGCGFGAVYAGVRWRLRALERQNAELEAKVAERTAALAAAKAEVEAQNQALAAAKTEVERKNAALDEKVAALEASQQRADRIFSALAEALPGTVLDGKYRLGRKLGAGGYGVVFAGEHLGLQRGVAVKVFKPVAGNDSAEALERFRREGLLAAQIRDRHVVEVVDAGVSGEGMAYLVMELLEGYAVREEMRGGGMGVERALRVCGAVCRGLAAAHGVGVVHRDVKPENVYVDWSSGEEVVKVVDFGIATVLERGGGGGLETLTGTGAVVGTPAYIAPERVVGGEYDGRADVYAVGVMLYEMVCGVLPFGGRGESGIRVLLAHVHDVPVGPGKMVAGLDEEVSGYMLRLLAKDAGERPTAAEAAAELERLADKVAAEGGVVRSGSLEREVSVSDTIQETLGGKAVAEGDATMATATSLSPKPAATPPEMPSSLTAPTDGADTSDTTGQPR